MLRTLADRLRDETGGYDKRPSYIIYRTWAHLAGVRVRGEHENPVGGRPVPEAARLALDEGVWPLQLVNPRDKEHVAVLHALFRSLPHVIEFYLDQVRSNRGGVPTHAAAARGGGGGLIPPPRPATTRAQVVFPATMEHQSLQLSASGHDLGGDMLFGRRLGFSGTPSDLLPLELGRCQYERGSDGKMLRLLTDPGVASLRPLPPSWSPASILLEVCRVLWGFRVFRVLGFVRLPGSGGGLLRRRPWSRVSAAGAPPPPPCDGGAAVPRTDRHRRAGDRTVQPAGGGGAAGRGAAGAAARGGRGPLRALQRGWGRLGSTCRSGRTESHLASHRIESNPFAQARGLEGVVFFGEDGEELFLSAKGRRVVPLPEAGVSDPSKRFTFYDQARLPGKP